MWNWREIILRIFLIELKATVSSTFPIRIKTEDLKYYDRFCWAYI